MGNLRCLTDILITLEDREQESETKRTEQSKGKRNRTLKEGSLDNIYISKLMFRRHRSPRKSLVIFRAITNYRRLSIRRR